jgi:periplasmic copper chaperone A
MEEDHVMTRIRTALASMLLATLAWGAQSAGISVTDPYARAVPPGQPNSAAFMGLTNGTGEDRALVGAESPTADVVELHTHVMDGGMMRMRRVDKIDLPAGQTVTLKPGGLHIMLIGLKGQLKPGERIDLTLIYDDGGRVSVTAPVRAIEAGHMSRH